MSNVDLFLESIRENLEHLLDEVVNGQEFVNRYDVLMADTLPDEMDQSGIIYQLLDNYHTEFAMYVADPGMRADRPDDYYGPEELYRKAESLLDALEHVQKQCGP
jgi:hypothetical protein